jgi:hypothetical protein
VVNPVESGWGTLNQAAPCWFVFAVVSRKTPPEAIDGRDGEPSVSTWHAGGGVELFLQTLVVLNPATGKLKVWAEAMCAPKKKPTSSPAAAKPRNVVFMIVSLYFLEPALKWLESWTESNPS